MRGRDQHQGEQERRLLGKKSEVEQETVRQRCLLHQQPALAYLGQGAAVLAHPETATNPFFLMVPARALLPLVLLATVAAVIASQAVITGAFSVAHQAMQLGLLPRLTAFHTSETEIGQI